MPTPSRTADTFRHCSACGTPGLAREGNRMQCGACGWTFFVNVAAAAAVLLTTGTGADLRVLLVRRALEPGRGRLGIPGGFVDAGESAQEAACREAREELGLDLDPAALRFLTSAPNTYPFAGVTYHSLDLYFTTPLPGGVPPGSFDRGEITELVMADPAATDRTALAFPAAEAALDALAAAGA